jgi:hypothetical protein
MEAAKLVIPLIEKTDLQIAEVRSGRKFSESELQHFAIRWFTDFKSRLMWDQPQLPDEVGLPLADEAELDGSLARWVQQESVPVTPGSADWIELRRLAFAEHYHSYAVRPVLSELRDDPGFRPVVDRHSPLKLSRVFDQFKVAVPNSPEDRKVAVERFIGLIGDRDITTITRADARTFRDKAGQVPKRMPNTIRAKSVVEQIAWGEKAGAIAVSPSSVNKQLSMLSSLLQWARNDAGLLDEVPGWQNPFAGIQVRDDRDQDEKRVALSVDNLNAIFAAEWYQRAKGAARWLPVLALYTGARLEELGQLETADVRQDGTVHYLAITPLDEQGKRTKRLKSA